MQHCTKRSDDIEQFHCNTTTTTCNCRSLWSAVQLDDVSTLHYSGRGALSGSLAPCFAPSSIPAGLG